MIALTFWGAALEFLSKYVWRTQKEIGELGPGYGRREQ
jgi:hypothetical protein